VSNLRSGVTELIALFKTLRDAAVHPKAAAAEPLPHPDATREERIATESAMYSVEGATRSVNLAWEVMGQMLSVESPAAKSVTAETAPRIEQLLAERRRLTAESNG
jgi:hypothetical protein